MTNSKYGTYTSTGGCAIYQITNTVTGDFYIGSSDNFQRRKRAHYSVLARNVHFNCYLQLDWNKYGEQLFEFSTILLCDIENKLYYEQVLIDELKPTYNIARCTTATFQGLHHTEETKRKIGEAQKGELNHNFGKHPSETTRSKISEAGKGRVVSKETRAKLSAMRKGESNYNFGKHPSDETRLKMGLAQKGRHHTAETRTKISMANRGELGNNFGKHHSEETKRKIGEAQKGKVASKETRAKMRESAIHYFAKMKDAVV